MISLSLIVRLIAMERVALMAVAVYYRAIR